MTKWIKSKTKLDFNTERCSNCNYTPNPGTYPERNYWCGNYCAHCGKKMENPHYHTIQLDFD